MINHHKFAGLAFVLMLAAGVEAQTPPQTAPPATQTTPPVTPAAPPVTPKAAPGASLTKIGVVDLQSVIIKTKDGEKAAADLKNKFSPKESELARKQQDIAALQQQLRAGQNTMSEENKQRLMREIDQKNSQLKRDTDDANQDLEQEQQRLMGALVPKIINVLNKYAAEHGFALVLDISNQQTPVIFVSNTVELTRDLIDAYDKSTAAPMTPPAAPKQPGTLKQPDATSQRK